MSMLVTSGRWTARAVGRGRNLVPVLGCLFAAACGGGAPAGEAPATATPSRIVTLTLPEEVERAEATLPPRAHMMTSVGDNWSQLWFAAQQKDWPRADASLEEARNQINLMIAIHPTHPDGKGGTADLKAGFDPILSGAFVAVKDAITRQDDARFAAAYRRSLEACYACHKAAGMPFLRLMIPTAPPQ